MAMDTIQAMLPHYSNTHSYVHQSAKISTHALAWAHDTVLNFVGADPAVFTSIFTGTGTTAATNRVARGLRAARPDKDVVFVSSMEHHANDLPHRHPDFNIVHLPLSGTGAHSGATDIAALQALCSEYAGRVNYIAVSAVSNVTGVCNPIGEICELAHQHDILVLVDGAQCVTHMPTELDQWQPDFFAFSGHKAYTPCSPGVLVARKSVLQSLPEQDLGGGSVNTVGYYDYELSSAYPQREQSGTPNIVGAIALASVLQELKTFGMHNIAGEEKRLMTQLIDGLSQVPGMCIYADPRLERRGAVAFNINGIDHGLVAAVLSDYYGIAVRNECFCAHPYVSSLLKEQLWELDLTGIADSEQENYINLKRGMVRVSLALYSTVDDINYLLTSITSLIQRIEELRPHYQALANGAYQHRSFALDWHAYLPFIKVQRGTSETD
ncbi:aminotransferase [Arenicella chitinivorans]|uniref:Aminotransferase n=2 Tax=Arenicella chitinivorans TaxID=1329800 RepID=A0A918RZG8_9GAMM|nr:aminotransferase [Arenicella chitinivorans]